MKQTLTLAALTSALMLSGAAVAGKSVHNAMATPEGEVKQAFASWRAALSSGKPERIVSLYAENAVLLATLANDPIDNQKGRTEYFTGLMKNPELKVALKSDHVRMLDEDDAVVSGVYTFSFKKDGKVTEIPARYTFVYEKQDDKWIIVDHHSSKLPL